MQLLEVVTFILYDELCTDNVYTVNYPLKSIDSFVTIGAAAS